MSLATQEFEFLRDLVIAGPGIVLEPDRQHVVEARLAQLALNEGFGSVSQLIEGVRKSPPTQLQRKLLDVITNNETWFFRDTQQFETLKNFVLPEFVTARRSVRKLVIWSAACSTGQEPYSIAMLVRENFPELLSWDFQIIATDYSSRVLQKAQLGKYSRFEVNRGMPATLLTKYFLRDGLDWQLRPEIRTMISFHQINLTQPSANIPRSDIVLLRNVLIYFDRGTRHELLDRIRFSLPEDALLVLGAAENVSDLQIRLKPVQINNTCWYRPC